MKQAIAITPENAHNVVAETVGVGCIKCSKITGVLLRAKDQAVLIEVSERARMYLQFGYRILGKYLNCSLLTNGPSTNSLAVGEHKAVLVPEGSTCCPCFGVSWLLHSCVFSLLWPDIALVKFVEIHRAE